MRTDLDEVLDEVEDDGLVRKGHEGLRVSEGEGTQPGAEAVRSPRADPGSVQLSFGEAVR